MVQGSSALKWKYIKNKKWISGNPVTNAGKLLNENVLLFDHLKNNFESGEANVSRQKMPSQAQESQEF